MVALMALGVASLGLGAYALACGQPYGIWYPPLLLGVIFTLVIGVNLPIVRRRYAEAEARKMEADAIRKG
jgi:hypothetical protein